MRIGIFRKTALIFIAGITAATFSLAAADHPQPLSGVFATPLTDAAIDNASLAEWCAGSVQSIADPNAIRQRVWTQSTMPVAGAYLKYGSCTQTGPRHFRIGFRTPVPVGTVLVRGSGQLSVLRPGAAYPGNMADDSQWIPAQHIVDRQVSTESVDGDNYAVWILPPGTQTRALRFTHVAAVTDSNYAGMVGSFYILSGRYANLAPEATVITSANSGAAPQLVDEKYGEFRTWDNGPDFAQPVSTSNPEWIMLSWPHAIALNGLAALWAGFNAADVQVFTGPDNLSPRDAPEADWHTVGQPYALRNQYPLLLGVDWMDFGKTIETRAVRLRITAATDESRHAHLAGKTDNGKRVWLGELMALSPLGGKDLQTAILPAAPATPNAPIPVRFTLPAAGFVSLVINDAQGNRVRNLVSDTYFQAGSNTVWWDGADDLGRDRDAADHGQYLIPTHFVAPGHYQVRGLVHQAIDLHYEFSLYDPGYPAWETLDATGGWLTSHTPASSALFLPADKALGGKPLVYLGCWYAEGGAGLAWMNLDGVKQGGRAWIGNDWTAAEFLARDTGQHSDSSVYAYTGAIWGNPKGQNGEVLGTAIVRIFGLTAKSDKSILSYSFDTGERPVNQEAALAVWKKQLGGIAVHDGVAVASLTIQNRLLFVNASTGKTMGQTSLENPRGLAFDSQGRLLALSSGRLLRYAMPSQMAMLNPQQLNQPEVLVASGLEDPSGITLDPSGNIYVSDQGNSDQVKVFSPAGRLLLLIGHAGPSKAGPYDPLHMNSPRGMTVDSNNHLWVAEDDFQPKRVSVWTLDGKLVKSFEGSAEYGGGGSLDPTDKTKYYYHGMEFKLDWQAGKDSLAAVLYRPGKDEIPLPRYGTPASVLHSHGHRYFDNTFLANTTNGSDIAVLYLDTGGIIRPVAALGKANAWDLLKSDTFRPLWPAGTDASSPLPKDSLLFTWSDTNNNGKVDPSEVSFLKAVTGSITVMSDLAMIDSYVEGKAMRYVPARLTPEGVPVYDLQHGEMIVDGAQQRSADGGGQVLYSPSAIVSTTAPLPFARDGLGGVDAQNHRWSYPSLWPGLHPSHSAPVPDHPGELIGTTRLLGDFIHPVGEDVGPLWAINGNFGPMYVFTADGLYVTQLFQDYRTGKPWIMPRPVRNMLLSDVSAHEENFFPSMTQMSDGNVYLIDGGRTSIVRVDGLSNIHRLPALALDVTKAQLDQAQAQQKQAALSRLQQQGPPTLEVPIRSGSSAGSSDLTQLFNTLKNQKWAVIDNRITQVGWDRHPDVSEAAVMIAGNRLVAAFRTQDANLLSNSGANANAPFKTGGALDLMIGADPHANPARETPVAGDMRLLVYQVNGVTKATLYRAVVAGTRNPVPFTSPLRTITLDRVDDVSSQVELKTMTGDAVGSFIFSIPLETLGLKPAPGEKIKADLGILRGNGQQTVQRVYWSNKATGITSDVPSEAELIPSLWGEWIFKTAQ